MLYRDKELDIRSGDVIIFASEFVPYMPMRYVSAGVRAFTGVNFNHAGVIVSNWGKLMINEAEASGVISRPADKFLDRYKNNIAVLRPKVEISEEQFCTRANSFLGTPYDFENLILDQPVYRVEGEWLGKTGDNASYSLECAEYAALCHYRKNYWEYSVRELLLDGYFEVIFKEKDIKIRH